MEGLGEIVWTAALAYRDPQADFGLMFLLDTNVVSNCARSRWHGARMTVVTGNRTDFEATAWHSSTWAEC